MLTGVCTGVEEKTSAWWSSEPVMMIDPSLCTISRDMVIKDARRDGQCNDGLYMPPQLVHAGARACVPYLHGAVHRRSAHERQRGVPPKMCDGVLGRKGGNISDPNTTLVPHVSR